MIHALAMMIYVVKPGDTLSGIVGNRWPSVCQENRIPDCNLIYPGQKIVVNGVTATVTGSRNDGDRDSDDGVTDPPIHVSDPPSLSGTLSCNGLESLWISAGGNRGSAFIAAEIAMAESGGQQYATGQAGERGYWQINPVNGYLSTYNAYGNARAAIILSDNGRNWSPWTTYTSGAYIGRCLHMTQVHTEPVPVHVVNYPEPREYQHRAAYRSIVLTAANPYQQVAGYDALREYVRFSPAANNYVICGSISQASDPNNAATPITNPSGRYVPAAIATEVCTEGHNEIWLAGNTFPTIIGFEIIRKVQDG